MPNLSELTGDQLKNELKRMSLDVIRVHNPTDKEFVLTWDASGTNEKWVIPSKDKDAGYGRGNRDLPRYVAKRFRKKMVDQLITQESEEQWEKLKKEYREDEYTAEIEKRTAIRINDPEYRKKWIKKVWLGIVKRHSDVYQEPEKSYVDNSIPQDQRLMEEMGLDDMTYQENLRKLSEEVKDDD